MQRTELSPREDEKVGVAKPTDESPAVVMADDKEADDKEACLLYTSDAADE